MLFKKSKKKKEDEKIDLENMIDAAIERAEEMSDPIKKIEKLSTISNSAYDLIMVYVEQAAMNGKSVDKLFDEDRHIIKLTDQHVQTERMITAVIENNLKEIAQSPSYPKVSRLKGIAEKFADAAAKYIAAEAEAPAVEETAPEAIISAEAVVPPESQKPISRPKPPQSYDKIVKAIKPS